MKEKMAADLLPTGEVPIDCLAQPNRPFTICAIHARDRVCQGVIVKVPPTTDTPACNSSLSPRPPVRRGIFQSRIGSANASPTTLLQLLMTIASFVQILGAPPPPLSPACLPFGDKEMRG